MLKLFRAVATTCWVLAWWIKILPPYEREFSTSDVVISHAHHKNQYVALADVRKILERAFL